MILSAKILGMVAAGSLVLAVAAYAFGRWDGAKSCEARHATSQLKQNEKVRKQNEKIKRSIPYSSDDNAAWEWLLKYGSK